MKVVLGEVGMVEYDDLNIKMLKVDFYVYNSFLHMFEVYCFVNEAGDIVPLIALNHAIELGEHHKSLTYFPDNINSFAIANGRLSDLGPQSSWFMQYLSTVHGINMYTDEFYKICPAFDTRSIEMIPIDDQRDLLHKKSSNQVVTMLFDSYYGISSVDIHCIFHLICVKLKQLDYRRIAHMVLQGSLAERRFDHSYDPASVLMNLPVELHYGMLRCLKVNCEDVRLCQNGEIEITRGNNTFKLNPVLDELLSNNTSIKVK